MITRRIFQGYWRKYPALTGDVISLNICEWISCINPPQAPPQNRLTNLQYNDTTFDYLTSEVAIGDKVKYYCFNGMKADDDFSFEFMEATCNAENKWTTDPDPPVWKTCIESTFKLLFSTIDYGYLLHALVGMIILTRKHITPSYLL